jgi:hypothetical protein
MDPTDPGAGPAKPISTATIDILLADDEFGGKVT